MAKKISDFNEELYAEMLDDDGCQYDNELYNEIAEYYLKQD